MDIFVCGICEKQFKTKRILKVHINRTHGEKIFACVMCEKRFAAKYLLQRHIKRMHEEKFECALCEKQFNRKGKLQLHISRSHNEDKFDCAICNKRFEARNLLQLHISRIHSGQTFVCMICEKRFRAKYLLQRHIIRVHMKKFECEACGEQFNKNRTLQAHINRSHNEENFECAICSKQFKAKKLIRLHIGRVHSGKKFVYNRCSKKFTRKHYRAGNFENNSPCDGNSVQYQLPVQIIPEKLNSHQLKCGFCNSYFSSRKGIQQHFQTDHEVILSRELLHFRSQEDFKQFKSDYQRKTITQFVLRNSWKGLYGTSKLYKCHRSGLHEPKKEAVRFPKIKGLKKIQAYCPAEMHVKFFEDGKCVVDFQEIHVGHNVGDQSELCHMDLNPEERQEIASKIQLGVSKNTILIKEELASRETEEKHQLQLLVNQDIENIGAAASCNVQNEFLSAFGDDLINVDAFAEMTAASILFYKKQSEEDTKFNILANDDFAIIFMNEFQEKNLRRYGKNIIAFDSTQGPNKYNFALHTLLIMDINYEGVPVAFLLSNRNDETIINILLQCIKEQIGILTPYVIMSDMQPTYKNSWVKIMQNEPNFTLWCTWHVREAWRRNYCKITDRKKREEVKKTLLYFAHELDPARFQIKLNEFLSSNDVDLMAFIAYFRRHYVENEKSLMWAYCYRKGAGINTNMSLESFHRSLKCNYKNGEKMDWLTCTLYCIHKYLSVEVMSEDISFYIGTKVNKLSTLRQKHHEARKTKDVTSKVHVINSSSWLVESFEKQDTMYFIEKREIKECSQYEDVICRLYCDFCKICFHEFSCNCLDAAIRNNMCKHIHAVGILLSTSKTHTADEDGEDKSIAVMITQQTTLLPDWSNESSQELDQVEKTIPFQENEIEDMYALEKAKQDVRNWLEEVLDKIPNLQILELIEKQFFRPVLPMIGALTSTSAIE